MYPEKIEKKYKELLNSLEKNHSKTIDYIEYIDDFLNKNNNFTKDEVFLIEDFSICLDIIRSNLNDLIFMLKKIKLESNEKVIFLTQKEKDDIFIDLNYSIADIFKK